MIATYHYKQKQNRYTITRFIYFKQQNVSQWMSQNWHHSRITVCFFLVDFLWLLMIWPCIHVVNIEPVSQFVSINNLWKRAALRCTVFADPSFILFWQSNLPASEDLLETSQGPAVKAVKRLIREVERPQRIGITKFWHFYTSSDQRDLFRPSLLFL